jgi:methylase of polypeptide subunit release factors
VAGERFDVVLCNPPFFRGTPRTPFEAALYSTDLARRFSDALPGHLTEGGIALVVLSTEGDIAGYEAAFRDAGLAYRIAVERDLISERVRLYRLAPLPR